MNYFEKWGYSEIRTDELDKLALIINEGINTFQDVVLLKQRAELMKQQSEQLREQVAVKKQNIEEMSQHKQNIELLIQEELSGLQNQFEIERKTNDELLQLQIKKQKQPELVNLQQCLRPIQEKLILQQKVQSKREELFGKNYNRFPPSTYKEALKENIDLKSQLQELQKK